MEEDFKVRGVGQIEYEKIFYPPMSLEDCQLNCCLIFLNTEFDDEYVVREWNNMGFYGERET